MVRLLADLGRTRLWDNAAAAAAASKEAGSGGGTPRRVHLALATSSHTRTFTLKTTHLDELFAVFESSRRVLGDDPRIPAGRGKPLPDIYLLALAVVNSSLPPGEEPIRPEECLVFEDSVPGVEPAAAPACASPGCPTPC